MTFSAFLLYINLCVNVSDYKNSAPHKPFCGICEAPVVHMLEDDKHWNNLKTWSLGRREGIGTNKTEKEGNKL